MSMNILNDISSVYLQQVAEKKDDSYLETDMKKRHENNEKAREEMKKTKANKDMVKAARKSMGIEEEKNDEPGEGTRQKYGDMRGLDRSGAPTSFGGKWQSDERKKAGAAALAKLRKEALDPVGQEDADIDNDGDTDSSDKYLHKRRKAIGKAIAKKKSVKEGFSNWRQDLSEVMDDVEANKKIKEKKVDNKIKINPDMKETVEELGGELVEMVELDEKALSKQQQKFMGMVYAVKKGEMKAPSPEVAKAASGMTKQQSKDFAKTKHKGLPKKVEESVDEMPMTPQELNLQKKKSAIDIMIAKRRQQAINKQK